MPVYEQVKFLLDQLKERDQAAFDYLFNAHRKWMTIAALQILKDEEESMDLVQEFFMDILEGKLVLQIGPPYKIKPYLFNIIRNRCNDRIRRHKVKANRVNPFFYNYPAVQEPEIKIEIYERQQEVAHALAAAFEHLPAQSATAFHLSYIHKMSRNQVAKKMSLSPHTVKNHIARAISILRRELKNI